MIDRIATWWLRRRGINVGIPFGVTLAGNCVALGQRDAMLVINPSGKVNTFLGSHFDLDDRDFAAAISRLSRRVD